MMTYSLQQRGLIEVCELSPLVYNPELFWPLIGRHASVCLIWPVIGGNACFISQPWGGLVKNGIMNYRHNSWSATELEFQDPDLIY